MKAMLTAAFVMVVVSVCANTILGEMGYSAQNVGSGANVRLE
jgi:hypothetical protein